MGIGLMPGLGMGNSQANGNGPWPEDVMGVDTGLVNKTEKGVPGKGKANATMVTGQRRETGAETYIEIKAPATVGNRSSVPYIKVLPSYRKKAESALDRQQIPKEHQKRVKEYFEGLGGK